MDPVRLQPGEAAPPFRLPDQDGQPVALTDLRGQRVVVYFYPAAGTPGCTRQAVDFRDSLPDLQQAGLAVLGVSPDPPAALRRFRDAQALTFPLLSDPQRATLLAYGAFGPKPLYGRTVTGVIRTTVLIDAEGQVERALYNVRATGHVAKLRRELGV